MLKDYKIELENGSIVSVLLMSHKYSPKFKCEYITCTVIEEPEVMNLPLIKKDGTYYIDYSFDKEKIEELTKSLSLVNFGKLPREIKGYHEEKKKSLDETEFELPLTKEEVKDDVIDELKEDIELPITKEATKVVEVEEVEIAKENKKDKILNIRLNDENNMLFKVIKENEENYECERLNDTDPSTYENDYEVIQSTFSTPDFYKLKGESNITTANHLPTKIMKKAIVNDNELLHVMIIKYLEKCYIFFLIKKENKDSYEIQPTTYDYIKCHPYDLIQKELQNEQEYLSFLDEFKVAYYNNSTMSISKSKGKSESSSLEQTRAIKLSEEKSEKIIEFDYPEDEEKPKRAV